MKFPLKDEIWESRIYPDPTHNNTVKIIGSGFARGEHIGRALGQGAGVFVVIEPKAAAGCEPWFELIPIDSFLAEYKPLV